MLLYDIYSKTDSTMFISNEICLFSLWKLISSFPDNIDLYFETNLELTFEMISEFVTTSNTGLVA